MSKCNQYNRTPDIMFLMGASVTKRVTIEPRENALTCHLLTKRKRSSRNGGIHGRYKQFTMDEQRILKLVKPNGQVRERH